MRVAGRLSPAPETETRARQRAGQRAGRRAGRRAAGSRDPGADGRLGFGLQRAQDMLRLALEAVTVGLGLGSGLGFGFGLEYV